MIMQAILKNINKEGRFTRQGYVAYHGTMSCRCKESSRWEA